MIPKIIHYCWFGGKSLPESALKCIDSWKKYFPDYEIKEWNESNYDVCKIPYIAEAYDAKKYAFVSDYARFDILYEYGGVYFDVDVEVIRPFGKILEDTGFMGMEDGGVAAGLGAGVAAGLGAVKDFVDSYAKEHFICDDGGINKYNLKTVVQRVTEILVEKGFDAKNHAIQRVADITIYPPEYFCPKSVATGLLNVTENTVSIHHYDASWVPSHDTRAHNRRRRIYSLFGDNVLARFLVFCDLLVTMAINAIVRFFVKPGPIGALKHYWIKMFSRKNKGVL